MLPQIFQESDNDEPRTLLEEVECTITQRRSTATDQRAGFLQYDMYVAKNLQHLNTCRSILPGAQILESQLGMRLTHFLNSTTFEISTFATRRGEAFGVAQATAGPNG